MKQLGLFSLIALVAGNCIGSGIFLLPASLAKFGTASLISWGITAFGALFLALVFSKLSARINVSGGPYTFCKEAFGNFAGFVTAYNYWIGMWIGSASVAVAATGYLSVFVPIIHESYILKLIFSLLIIWCMTLTNLSGIGYAGIIQIILTVLKIAPIAILMLGSLNVFNTEYIFPLTAANGFFADIISGASLTLWAFIGIESASVPASFVKNPKINIPLATIIGTLITAVVYILSSVFIFALVPTSVLAVSSAPFSQAAMMAFGFAGAAIMSLTAIISSVGSLNGWILLQGQMPFALSKDKLLPNWFSKLKNGTPANSVLLSSFLTSLMLLLTIHENLIQTFEILAEIAVFSTLIVYFITCAAYIKQFGVNLTVALAVFYVLGMLLSIGWFFGLWGMLLSMTAIPLYYFSQWYMKS